MDEKTLLTAAVKAIKELKPEPTVTKIAQGGTRNPWAGTNLVTSDGSVYRITIKRLIA